MRIAIFSNGFEDYSIQLANALSKEGNDVFLIMYESISEEFDQCGKIDGSINKFIYCKPRLYSLKNLFVLIKVLNRIIKYDPDIIHTQGSPLWLSLLFPIFKFKNFKLIITFHDPKPHIGENHLRIRFPNFLGRLFSDSAFVHGEKLKRLMIEEYRYPANKVYSIPIGEHQVEPFIKYLKNNPKYINNSVLFFGRIYAYKGLDYLIKAEPMIRNNIPDVKIIIAGTGEDFEKYKKLMTNQNSYIVYNYRIPYPLGARLFDECNLVVLPYIDASQSGVVLTAYGFKKPVVVTDVGAISEIVDNGLTGLIVPPKSPEALAEAVVTLLKDKDKCIWMGNNGFNKLKTDLAWKNIVKKILPVYQKS